MHDIRELIDKVNVEESEDTQPEEAPLAPWQQMLLTLQTQSHIYAGTVPVEEIARRRKKNKQARQARKGNKSAIARQARRNKARNSFRRFGVSEAPDPLGLRAEVEEVDE